MQSLLRRQSILSSAKHSFLSNVSSFDKALMNAFAMWFAVLYLLQSTHNAFNAGAHASHFGL